MSIESKWAEHERALASYVENLWSQSMGDSTAGQHTAALRRRVVDSSREAMLAVHDDCCGLCESGGSCKVRARIEGLS